VITDAPVPTDLATPVAASIVATEELLEVQVAALMMLVPTVAVWLVRLTVVPEVVVAKAIKLAVWPIAVEVCAFGETARAEMDSVAVLVFEVTVRVALPAAAEPS
jgi:hypothetical protein